MELSEIIGIDAVRAPLKATSKKRLLQDLADMAEAVYRLPAAAVYKSLMDREALGPTGVGRGVAIPHARLAGVPNVIGLFIRLEKPVDFESIDRQPVDLVFALFAPEAAGADHLKALARVSRRCGATRSAPSCVDLRPFGALCDPDRRQGPRRRPRSARRPCAGRASTARAGARLRFDDGARKSRNSSRRSGRAIPKATVACR